MARVVQIESKRPARSALTPELKDFIDRCIVPALVREYLSATSPQNCLEPGSPEVRNSRPTAHRRASEEKS